MRWTDDLDDLLLRGFRNGAPRDVIAARVTRACGISCDAASIRNRLAILRRNGFIPAGSLPWPGPMKERLRALYMTDGLSFSGAAKILSVEFDRPVSRSAAIGQARRMGLLRKQPPRERKRRERARATGVAVAQRVSARAAGETVDRPLPPPRVDDLPPLVASLVELEPHHCRWPLGDRAFAWCGRDRVAGKPYCERHAAVAYAPPRGRAAAPLVLPSLLRRTG